MAYKAILGLSEIVVGVLLAIPSFDPQATFARLSAEELREDPGDRFVAQVSRHLPALLHHRGLIAVGLMVFGLAKLVAAAPCGRARNGAATCSRPLWRCCCPSTCTRPLSTHLEPCPTDHGEHGRARRARAPCAGLAAWSAIPRPTQPPIGAASLDVQLIRTPPPLIASTLGAYPPAPTAAFDSCARHNG